MTKKVLICDDEEGIRESLKLILEDNYELVLVEGAEQCLHVLEHSEDIGVVLMDIKMPQVNGLEALEAIHEKYPNMKVVMVTGYKSVETASEASNLGAVDYIVKPFNSKEILETVAQNLN